MGAAREDKALLSLEHWHWQPKHNRRCRLRCAWRALGMQSAAVDGHPLACPWVVATASGRGRQLASACVAAGAAMMRTGA